MSQATDEFKNQLRAAFDEIALGQVFAYTRTFMEADLALFCGVTGDFNPYHMDDSFAEQSFFGQRILPGLLVGSMLTHIGGMLGILATEMHFEFLQPVLPGDTITCAVTFVEKDAELRTLTGDVRYTNQHGAEVQHARFRGFPGRVRLTR